jgi:hypothetical protein
VTKKRGDDTTGSQTLPPCFVVPTASQWQDTVAASPDGSTGDQIAEGGGSGGDTDADADDGGLSANTFGLDADDLDPVDLDADEIADLLDTDTADIDDLLDEVATDDDLDALLDEIPTGDDLDALLDEHEQADLFAEQVARQWGTPEGEWWP